MVIRAIVFDCFGVLVTPGYSPLFQMFPEKKKDVKRLVVKMDSGLVTMPEYFELAGKAVGLTSEQVAEIYQKKYVRNEKVINWVEGLKQFGKVKMGLLSNVGRDRMEWYFPDRELNEIFDVVLLSSDVGIVKPDPQIYKMMIAKLRVKPSECLVFDDQLVNVEAAKKVGMKGVVFESVEQASAELNWMLELADA